ncbi:hypothetical protein HD806DRAFT_9891 [Xylariaceae sp. AK1471]|nr:hypothetical protein HD806DRAFT_9891 [Xylariaceae sp. AK1471]
MSTRILQATRQLPRHLARPRQRMLAVGIGSCIGLTVGTGVAMRSSPLIRFDSLSSPSPSSSSFSTSSPAFSNAPREKQEGKEKLNPELMKQLSGGSVTGFLSGLLVSVFSKTLVLLLGVSVVIVQVAARYGIDIVDQLRLKQRLGNSRVSAALKKDPVFKLSFGLFFALSAFMQF